MIRDLAVTDAGGVSFTFLLAPEDPATLVRQARAAVQGVEGVRRDDDQDHRDQSRRARRRSPTARRRSPAPAPPPARPIAAPSSRTSAGSSRSRRARAGWASPPSPRTSRWPWRRTALSVGLMDADIYGPNIPRMFGVFDKPPVIGGKIQPLEAHGVKLMSLGFLVERDAPAIWRGPIIMKIVHPVPARRGVGRARLLHRGPAARHRRRAALAGPGDPGGRRGHRHHAAGDGRGRRAPRRQDVRAGGRAGDRRRREHERRSPIPRPAGGSSSSPPAGAQRLAEEIGVPLLGQRPAPAAAGRAGRRRPADPRCRAREPGRAWPPRRMPRSCGGRPPAGAWRCRSCAGEPPPHHPPHRLRHRGLLRRRDEGRAAQCRAAGDAGGRDPRRSARRHAGRGLPAGPDLAPVSRRAPSISPWSTPASAPRAPRWPSAPHGHWFVGPDNGLFTPVLQDAAVEIVDACRLRRRRRPPSTAATSSRPRRRRSPAGTPLQTLGQPFLGIPHRLSYREPHYEGKSVVGRDRLRRPVRHAGHQPHARAGAGLRGARGRGARHRPAPAHLRRRADRRPARLRRLGRARSRSRCGTAPRRGGWGLGVGGRIRATAGLSFFR